MGTWGLSLLLLTIPVVLADSTESEVKVLRSFNPIDVSDANVKQCVWFALQEYNKDSEDKYVFLVARTMQAQLQITNRMEYLISVLISRSNCRKPLNHDRKCVIQENSKLEKKINCSFLVAALPWNGEFTLLMKQCEAL